MKNTDYEIESFYFKKNILVTGASGFIASWLINELISLNSTIYALSKGYSNSFKIINAENLSKINLYTGNIHEISSIGKIVKEVPIDIIFHLAAVNTNYGTDYSPFEVFETNVRGMYNVLESVRKFGHEKIKIITLSSREIEDNKNNVSKNKIPIYHPYDISKQCSDKICSSYGYTYGMNTSILVSSNVFGGGDLNWNRIIPGTIRSLKNGERPFIRSSGNLSRNYIYVSDIVSALLFIARTHSVKNTTKVYNVKDRDVLKTNLVIKTICKMYEVDSNKIDILNSSSSEKEVTPTIRENEIDNIGWKPMYNFREGLKLTLDWYNNYYDNVLTNYSNTIK